MASPAAAAYSVRGAAVEITVEQAEEVLKQMKAALEAAAVQASTQKGL